MEDKRVAIQLKGIKKKYKLGEIGGKSLQADLQSWWARIHGREDPNTKIGQENRLSGHSFMALNGIDLTVYQGEVLGIIGPNGAGKSTMLKLLSRVTAPTEGDIDLYGRIASMLEVGTGFNGEMTGRENIYMNGAILGMTKTEIDAKMEDIIEFSEVRDFIDTPVKRYSSGMYVKLAFSVAAHLDSEIMIMDEVLAVGDSAFQRKCLDKMRKVAKEEGRTVLYVSHNMNTIRALCDRCIVLREGKIIFDGNVNQAIDVYMEETADEGTFFDFSSKKRYPHLSQALKLVSLKILNHDQNSIEEGEDFLLTLQCVAKKDVEGVKLRLEVHFADGTNVGTAISNCSITASQGQVLDIEARLDVSNLTPGIYKCTLVSFICDELGHQSVIDLVDGALTFTVMEPTVTKLIWLSQNWGHVHLNNLDIVEINTSREAE